LLQVHLQYPAKISAASIYQRQRFSVTQFPPLRFPYADSTQNKSASDGESFALFFAFVKRIEITCRSALLVPLFHQVLNEDYTGAIRLEQKQKSVALEERNCGKDQHKKNAKRHKQATFIHRAPNLHRLKVSSDTPFSASIQKQPIQL
jgi:hypothetical protein